MPRRLPAHRSTIALATLVCAVAGLLVAAPVSSATPSGGAARSAVISGDARFEVLSPTLIRTEYADEARFVDAPTFNAIGRDDFTPRPSRRAPATVG